MEVSFVCDSKTLFHGTNIGQEGPRFSASWNLFYKLFNLIDLKTSSSHIRKPIGSLQFSLDGLRVERLTYAQAAQLWGGHSAFHPRR